MKDKYVCISYPDSTRKLNIENILNLFSKDTSVRFINRGSSPYNYTDDEFSGTEADIEDFIYYIKNFLHPKLKIKVQQYDISSFD